MVAVGVAVGVAIAVAVAVVGVVIDPPSDTRYMRVAKAMALGESRAMRCYAKVGKVLIAHGSTALLDEALLIVSSRRKLAEFDAHLLPPKRVSAPDPACVA